MSENVCIISKKLGLIIELGNINVDDIKSNDEGLVVETESTFEIYGNIDDVMDRKLTELKLGDILIIAELAKKFFYNFTSFDQELRFIRFTWRLIKHFDKEAEIKLDTEIDREMFKKYKTVWIYDLIYKG